MGNTVTSTEQDTELFVIRDPDIDVEALMTRVRENVARRQSEGAYREDLDAIAEEVFAEVANVAAATPAATGFDLDATLAEVNTRWMVREAPFTSQAPYIGPVIVAVRNFWNWMSTKWYVRAILQQQVGFNGLVARALIDGHAAHGTLAAEVRQLEALCQQQSDQIALLTREIERLRSERTGNG